MQSYLVRESTLTEIADAIRQQTGTAGTMSLESMPGKIRQLTNTSSANATETDILAGKTAYVGNRKITGKKVTVKITSSRSGMFWYYNGTKFVEASFNSGYSGAIQVQKGSTFIVLGTASRPQSYSSSYTPTYPVLSVTNGTRFVEYRSFLTSSTVTMLFFYFVHVNGDASVTMSTSTSMITS